MFWKKRRYIVVVLAFFGFFNVYSLRVNLSVAIVAMTENRTIDYGNGTYGYVRERWALRLLYRRQLENVFNVWLFLGTIFQLDFNRTGSHSEFIFLWIHSNSTCRWLFWSKVRRKYSKYFVFLKAFVKFGLMFHSSRHFSHRKKEYSNFNQTLDKFLDWRIFFFLNQNCLPMHKIVIFI